MALTPHPALVRKQGITKIGGAKVSNIIRVIKNANYTTLSNYHFKDKRLSWKAKGLLSTMLSLPDNWDFTVEGLATLSGDGVKSTSSGLKELEEYGYLVREQHRNEKGFYAETCYNVYEQPVEKAEESPERELTEPTNDYNSQPICQNGRTDESLENSGVHPISQNRRTDNRRTDNRMTENDGQLNTNKLNTNKLNTSSSSYSDDVQQNMRKNLILDEEAKESLRKRLELEHIAEKYNKPKLVEAVFVELCKRDYEFVQLMNRIAFEQVCLSIMHIQSREPVRMLPNYINKCLDNIICGIEAAGAAGNKDSPYSRISRINNVYNNIMQNHYDFDELEKELLSN